jgi:hypothetical protein
VRELSVQKNKNKKGVEGSQPTVSSGEGRQQCVSQRPKPMERTSET